MGSMTTLAVSTCRAYCGGQAYQCYLESAMGRSQGVQLALGLCEVAIRDSGMDAIAVPDENAVALRSVLLPLTFVP